MKIRTLTCFVFLSRDEDKEQWRARVSKAATVLQSACASAAASTGLEVQTFRIATNPFEEYLDVSEVEGCVAQIIELEQWCAAAGVSFLSVGPARTARARACCGPLVERTENVSCTIDLDQEMEVSCRDAAQTCVYVSSRTKGGEGNFRFGALAGVGAGAPFFPAAFASSDEAIGIAVGCECSSLLHDAVERMQHNERIACRRDALYSCIVGIFQERLRPVVDAVASAAREAGARFLGVDSSVAPSLAESESLAIAFERSGMLSGPFGGPGTLAVSSVVTRAIQALDLPLCGYCGLMLPVCEDAGLAARAVSGDISVTSLLAFSSVCGTGLDTVPVAGNVCVDELAAVYLDVACLSSRLRKPLSARLFPVPGKLAGDRVTFATPYLLDSVILPLHGTVHGSENRKNV